MHHVDVRSRSARIAPGRTLRQTKARHVILTFLRSATPSAFFIENMNTQSSLVHGEERQVLPHENSTTCITTRVLPMKVSLGDQLRAEVKASFFNRATRECQPYHTFQERRWGGRLALSGSACRPSKDRPFELEDRSPNIPQLAPPDTHSVDVKEMLSRLGGASRRARSSTIRRRVVCPIFLLTSVDEAEKDLRATTRVIFEIFSVHQAACAEL